MEHCRHGDLQQYLQKNCPLAARQVQQLAYQILEGLDQMHQNDFAHRDLKPGNILIKSMPPEKRRWIVLADFGISKRADESHGPTTVIKGTDAFMALELLGYLINVRPKSIADFKAADMWAFGEILFQMLTGKTTFQNPVEKMRYCPGQQEFPLDRLPTAIADDGYEFIGSLMMALPQDRITTTQCIQHRWIESLVEDEFDALNLEHKNTPTPEKSPNEPAEASAQWSSLSSLEHRPTRTTAQRRPETLLHSSYSSARQNSLQSTFNGQSIQRYPTVDQGSVILAEIALEQAPQHKSKVDEHGISDLAFSPNGKWLVFMSSNLVQLWDVRSGKLVQYLETFSDRSSSVISSNVGFSPDGKQLAFANTSPTYVQLWDAKSGKPVQALAGYFGTAGCICYVVFSPDGKHLASLHTFGTVHLFDVKSGMLVRTLESREYLDDNHTVFSPDGKRLASISKNGTVWFWDVGSGKVVQKFKVCGLGHSIDSAAFSPDCKRLSISLNGTVRLWDAGSGKLMQTPKSRTSVLESRGVSAFSVISSVAFSPDGKRVTSTSTDRMVQLWDAGSGKILHTHEGQWNNSYGVAFSPDSKRLASASYDGKVRLWGKG